MLGRALTCMLATCTFAGQALADPISVARYEEPTDRYDHAILGDAIEWGALVIQTEGGKQFRLRLPETRVFEDFAPRLFSPPGEDPLVAVIETDLSLGARLALYRETGLVAATPFIGSTHRWLAPIGAADLDGDGRIEFAYVDRPHLARTIMVWRYNRGALTLAGQLDGYTNHRIGEDNIAGGMRDCGQGPEMVVADASWSTIYAVTWDGSGFAAQPLGPHRDRSSFAAAMACR